MYRKIVSISLSLLVAFTVLILVDSCSYDNGDVPEPKDTTSCDTSKVSWCNGISEILLTHCSADGIGSCHQGGSAFGDFTFYAGAKAKVDNSSLMLRVVTQKDMPSFVSSGPALTQANRDIIEQWINAGAPEE